MITVNIQTVAECDFCDCIETICLNDEEINKEELIERGWKIRGKKCVCKDCNKESVIHTKEGSE